MSTALLLTIAVASVLILLLLVIKAKVHPFVALLVVSLLVAIATGIPADNIIGHFSRHGRPARFDHHHYRPGRDAGGDY